MKQSAKVASILLLVCMVPSFLFASGSNENDEYHEKYRGEHWEEMEHWGRGRHSGRGRHGFWGGSIPGMLGGVYVTEVLEGSPAAAAGLQTKDVILAVNNEKVFDLRSSVQDLSPGDSLTLTIARYQVENDDRILPDELKITMTLEAGEDGAAYAGIQYKPQYGEYGEHGRRFGGKGKGFFHDLSPEEMEELKELYESFYEFMEEKELENSSL